MVCSATFVLSHIHKYTHSLRFIAVLDDCNDSKEADNDQMQEEGEGERMRRRREEEREKGREGRIQRRREGERKEGRKGERKEKRETKGEGRRKGREEERKGERALLASAVHVARAPYMNVTQDVAVGLSCILCTPTLEYPEYHTRLRPICLIFYENSK